MENMFDVISKIASLISPIIVVFLILALFQTMHQRDTYKELYCAEVVQSNPDHPVCGEQL